MAQSEEADAPPPERPEEAGVTGRGEESLEPSEPSGAGRAPPGEAPAPESSRASFGMSPEADRLTPPLAPRPRAVRPWGVRGVILACVAIHVIPRWLGGDGGASAQEWMLEHLAHDRFRVWDGEWWRLISSTFLHAGYFHLGSNLLVLHLAGRHVEPLMGHCRLLVGYLISAVCGALLFQATAGTGTGLGASGAVLGVLGMFLTAYLCRFGRDRLVLRRRFWIWMGLVAGWLVVEAFLGRLFFLAQNVDVDVALSAHLGGFLGGVLFALPFFSRGDPAHRARRALAWGGLAAYVILVGSYGLLWPAFDWTRDIHQARRAWERDDESAARAFYESARRLGGDEAAAAIIQTEIEKRHLDEALEYWRDHPMSDAEAQRRVGYLYLFDALAADGRDRESRAVLEELTRLADEALREERTPELLNEAAWYRALRDTDLDTALGYAREAYGELRESAVLNTLGWVQFLRGESESAMRNLLEAARMEPSGSNFVYLALAYWRLQDKQEAKRCAALARRAGGLQAHEGRLLDDLEASLESG